jgi:hypothetical protein
MPLIRINGRTVFFVHVPKTGGTSIENTLAGVGQLALHRKPFPDWVPPQHWHAEIHSITVPAPYYDIGFLVCRNPYTRLVSEFRHRARKDHVREKGFDRWAAATLDEYSRNPYVLYNHIRPQSEFHAQGIEIHRFEDGLQAAIDRIADFCGLRQSPEMRRDNVSPRLTVKMSRHTAQRITRFYAADFTHFDYDPEALDQLSASDIHVV